MGFTLIWAVDMSNNGGLGSVWCTVNRHERKILSRISNSLPLLYTLFWNWELPFHLRGWRKREFESEQEMNGSISVCILLSLLILSPASSLAGIFDHPRLPLSNFPSTQAEKLIRQLNLFPKSDANIIHRNIENSSLIAVGGKKIVERRLRFPIFDDSGVSLEELGHHAGYYKIEHSHAARWDLWNPMILVFYMIDWCSGFYMRGYCMFNLLCSVSQWITVNE